MNDSETEVAPYAPLRAPLPDHLYWLTERAEALVRPGAFLRRHPELRTYQGATRSWGLPDIPADGAWPSDEQARHVWGGSPHDSESFWLQLDLEGIPPEVRTHLPAGLPGAGVVWVFLDLSGKDDRPWRVETRFDRRPAASIPWRPRLDAKSPEAAEWLVQDTMTCATEATLPEIAGDYRLGAGMAVDFDGWWSEHYSGRAPSETQCGGWMHPIQGDADIERGTLVLAMERQAFGDSGAVYLHWSAAHGFFAHATTG